MKVIWKYTVEINDQGGVINFCESNRVADELRVVCGLLTSRAQALEANFCPCSTSSWVHPNLE
ncbi:hypothetical protein M7I_2870 [Glarea lozoyensis 74030]|uniref:Uncharacterized protein n=1 Tax=Glarea lozoyensis (strain ATCC 74030 / MF5533) TaxID=1104152 RepID=H0EJY6_GLAL7|nr:hypothetical protein M7I_2870 [Glarea lozoyensis 74030]